MSELKHIISYMWKADGDKYATFLYPGEIIYKKPETKEDHPWLSANFLNHFLRSGIPVYPVQSFDGGWQWERVIIPKEPAKLPVSRYFKDFDFVTPLCQLKPK